MFYRTRLNKVFAGLLACLALASQANDKPIEEVPFVVTPPRLVTRMLQMAEVSAKDVVYDLGSGDGRIVIAAAGLGAQAFGVEIDPALVKQSEERAKTAKLEHLAKFAVQDIFDTDFSKANVITMYLLPEFNLKLRPTLLKQLKPGSRVVSHEWDMGDWAPDETLNVRAPEKPLGSSYVHQLFLWVIPATVAGTWQLQLEGKDKVTFSVEQKHQILKVNTNKGSVRMASLRGRQLILNWFDGERTHRLQGEVSEDGRSIKGKAGALNQEHGTRDWQAVRQ